MFKFKPPSEIIEK